MESFRALIFVANGELSRFDFCGEWRAFAL